MYNPNSHDLTPSVRMGWPTWFAVTSIVAGALVASACRTKDECIRTFETSSFSPDNGWTVTFRDETCSSDPVVVTPLTRVDIKRGRDGTTQRVLEIVDWRTEKQEPLVHLKWVDNSTLRVDVPYSTIVNYQSSMVDGVRLIFGRYERNSRHGMANPSDQTPIQ